MTSEERIAALEAELAECRRHEEKAKALAAHDAAASAELRQYSGSRSFSDLDQVARALRSIAYRERRMMPAVSALASELGERVLAIVDGRVGGEEIDGG